MSNKLTHLTLPGDVEREIVDALARTQIGDLSKLNTQEKGTLVEAINAASTALDWVTEEDVDAMFDETYEEVKDDEESSQ